MAIGNLNQKEKEEEEEEEEEEGEEEEEEEEDFFRWMMGVFRPRFSSSSHAFNIGIGSKSFSSGPFEQMHIKSSREPTPRPFRR